MILKRFQCFFPSKFKKKQVERSSEKIEFSKFRGFVTILVNVASYCGYTDSHYRGLVRLWRQISPSEQVNLLAFPCNQFGAQEPGTTKEIEDFAHGYGVEFTMMDKIDVNGPNASIVYKYLKSKAEIGNIAWNFASKLKIAKCANCRIIIPLQSK